MLIGISVIVAVYQAEKYISRCLDSLLLQSFDNFEIILIDDGSWDQSGKICDHYKEKDKRIRVVHKENEGVSKTRQLGLNLARGQYVIYVDPDDWVEKEYLEVLYRQAIAENADMIICDFWVEYWKKSIYITQRPSKSDSRTVLEELFSKLIGCTWNKLVKKELYKKYDIKFPEDVHFCEDLYVNCCLLIHDIKIAYVPKALYHYDQIVNSNSLVRYYDESTYEHDMDLMMLFIDLFKNINEPINMRRAFARNLTERAFWSGKFGTKEFKKKFGHFSGYLKLEKDARGRFYYLSSIGFYFGTYKLAILGKKIKRLGQRGAHGRGDREKHTVSYTI